MGDRSMMVLEKMMDVSAFRQKLLTSNIANADTPGYKAKDISFQNELNGAVDEASRGISGGKSFNVYEAPNTMLNRDGNTVNLEMEMAKVAENTLIYNTATQLMSMKIRGILNVLK
jgi:flagellar basal-body rod protein FlgB